MAEFPYMQLWVAELMSDRKVLAMTNEEFGIYMRLLCAQWLDGPIPMSDAIAISSVSVLPERVLSCFSMREHEKLVNQRLEKEWKKLHDDKKNRSKKAKTAAKSRWVKKVTSDANALPEHAPSNARAMLGDAISYSYSDKRKNIQKEEPPDVCVPDFSPDSENDNLIPNHVAAQEGAFSQNREQLEKSWTAAKLASGFPAALDRNERNHMPALCHFVDADKMVMADITAAMVEFWKRKKTDKSLDKWGLQAFINNFSKFIPVKKQEQYPGITSKNKFFDITCPHCKRSATTTVRPPPKITCGGCGKEIKTEY
jgi:uncharacterized protein YdaU (DUF1376 family)/ribosomal protein S27E